MKELVEVLVECDVAAKKKKAPKGRGKKKSPKKAFQRAEYILENEEEELFPTVLLQETLKSNQTLTIPKGVTKEFYINIWKLLIKLYQQLHYMNFQNMVD